MCTRPYKRNFMSAITGVTRSKLNDLRLLDYETKYLLVGAVIIRMLNAEARRKMGRFPTSDNPVITEYYRILATQERHPKSNNCPLQRYFNELWRVLQVAMRLWPSSALSDMRQCSLWYKLLVQKLVTLIKRGWTWLGSLRSRLRSQPDPGR